MPEKSETVESAVRVEHDAYFEGAADFYRFLSNALVRELTEAQIDALASLDLEFADDGGDLARGLKGMRVYLKRRGCNAREDLAVDYARVFLAAGVYEGDTAVPYESVFTSPEKILMQDARDDVVRIYRENGLAVDPDLKVPEDHLGFELEFVAFLCERVAKAGVESAEGEKLLGTLKEFIKRHLLNWVPELRDRVRETAELRFYPAVMDLVVGYVKGTLSVIEEIEEERSMRGRA